MTLATVRQRVKDYLIDVPTATSNLVDHWINRAVRAAEDDHNFPHMRETGSFTTSLETRKLADKPSDWKARRDYPWLHEGDGGSREILWAPSKSAMIRRFSEDDTSDTGAPRYVLELPDVLEVYPLADDNSLWDDGDYRVQVPYWARSPDLTGNNSENWFTKNAEDYLIFFATAEGLIFNREEERAAVYVGKANAEFSRLKRVEKQGKSPRTISVRTDVYG